MRCRDRVNFQLTFARIHKSCSIYICHKVASAFSLFNINFSRLWIFLFDAQPECEALTCPRRSKGAVGRAAGCAVSIHWWIFWVIRHSWMPKWSWFTEGSGVRRWLGLQGHAMTSHTHRFSAWNDSLTRTLISFFLELRGGTQKRKTCGLGFLQFCKWDHQRYLQHKLQKRTVNGTCRVGITDVSGTSIRSELIPFR